MMQLGAMASPLHRCLSVPRSPLRCITGNSHQSRPSVGVRTHVATVERTNPVTQPSRLPSSADGISDPDENVRAIAQACPRLRL